VEVDILILDDHFTVDQGGLAPKLLTRLDHPAVLVTPVMAAAGESTDVASVDPQQGGESRRAIS
jgi:hypothetical protein